MQLFITHYNRGDIMQRQEKTRNNANALVNQKKARQNGEIDLTYKLAKNKNKEAILKNAAIVSTFTNSFDNIGYR